MKAQLNFDMDEPDDRMEHLCCLKSLGMASVLWELYFNTRRSVERQMENNSKMTSDDVLDFIFDELMSLLDEHDINIGSLVQ